MVNTLSKLPRYVLKNGAHAIGPVAVSNADPNADSPDIFVIYGFSSKLFFDQFIPNRKNLLTPYPLVRRFLQDRVEAEPTWLQLVVLDAVSQVQQTLHAATMQSIMEAMDLKQDFISVTHSLELIGSGDSYCVIKSPLPLSLQAGTAVVQ